MTQTSRANVVYQKWPQLIQDGTSLLSMSSLELVAALFSIIVDIENVANKSILFRIDNVGSVRIWRKGYSTSDPISSSIVKAMYEIAISVNAVVYCNHVPRRSTIGAILADDFSKGHWVSGLVTVLGPDRIINGWKLPEVPRALRDWLSNPTPDDDLGSKILYQMARQNNPPNLLGYNVIPHRIQ